MPGLPTLRLHQADDVMDLCSRVGQELGDPDPALPYWAFPWAGGLAVVRYLTERPDEVVGRSVLDLASASGLCAIVAARQGASEVVAVDVDPLAEAAVALNADANDVRIEFIRRDVLGEPPPPADVILAGDVCYEEPMASRVLAWLASAATAGTRVILGDPGRRYLPPDLVPLGTYDVLTSRELEDADVKRASVYTLP